MALAAPLPSPPSQCGPSQCGWSVQSAVSPYPSDLIAAQRARPCPCRPRKAPDCGLHAPFRRLRTGARGQTVSGPQVLADQQMSLLASTVSPNSVNVFARRYCAIPPSERTLNRATHSFGSGTNSDTGRVKSTVLVWPGVTRATASCTCSFPFCTHTARMRYSY